MHFDPSSRAVSDQSAPQTLIAARRAVIAAVTLALFGSLYGFTVGRAMGAITGAEVWLTGSCVLFCAIVLIVLLRRPFDVIRWIAPVASIYFLAYLTIGAVMSIGREALAQNFMIYLLWFFPLIAFNRFANVTRYSGTLSLIIFSVALVLALSRAVMSPVPELEVPLMIVYCLTVSALTLVLGLFARYREAYIQTQARAKGLEATNRAVAASERRFRGLFSNAASGIGWLSMDGQCVEVNETFGRMVGQPVAELNGRPFSDIVHADSRATWQAVHEALRSGERREFDGDLSMCDASGRTLQVRMSFAVLARDGVNPEAIAFVCQDVTEAQQLAARLQQAQRLESIGQLTGGIAHDFNNLLTVILGNADTLRRALAGQNELAELARMTGSAAERGAKLTSQLLAFARRQALSPRSTDVAALLTELQPLLRRSLGEAVALELAVGPDLWPTRLDPVQLESAVLNLCINARDAMPDGGRLLIEMRNIVLDAAYGGHGDEIVPGAYVQIAITDNGCGMSQEQLERAFEPFYTTKDVGRGSGLGLSMVYGFVRQSSGHVRIYSELGEGTTVKLFLPRSEDVLETEPDTDTVSVEQLKAGATVLVVEDDDLVRDYVTSQLESLGYQARVTTNGREALQVLSADDDVDLLFSDVVMPGDINGIELCRRAQALRPSLPILLTSGYTEFALTREQQIPEGVGILSKPYRLKELSARLAALLDTEAA